MVFKRDRPLLRRYHENVAFLCAADPVCEFAGVGDGCGEEDEGYVGGEHYDYFFPYDAALLELGYVSERGGGGGGRYGDVPRRR